jgi:threonine/homoserine/homoserine lactone efflux protein
MLTAALVGFVLGFLGSVPVAGPIAVLVLERSLAQRYADAEGIAVGGAVAESLYAAAAFLGFGVLVNRFPVLLVGARVAGALILVVVAHALWNGRNRPIETRKPRTAVAGRLRGFGLGFSVTAMNPTLLATWSVVSALAFGAFSLRLTWGSAFSFPIGAGLGVASWLLIFVRILRRGGERLSDRAQERLRIAMIAFVLTVALWFAYEAATAYRAAG